ncbi:MAG TPA: hypothetical protein PK122_01560 [Candidatus Paceibacterota bacterium]|nr:hypothetical protein [Candidatus Paceibacterota bacterium]
MLVRENINFERGKNPKDALEIGIRKSLEQKGVEFDTTWDKSGEEDKKVNLHIENIAKTVELLMNAGVNPEDISISKWNHFYVRVVRVLEGNAVKFECLSEDDGKKLIQVLTDLAIENRPQWHLSWDTKLVYTDDIQDWLKNLKKNREKYSKIL